MKKIQNNVFNDKFIVGEIWDTTVSYLGSSQGKAKEILKENAQIIIEKIEVEYEKHQDKE